MREAACRVRYGMRYAGDAIYIIVLALVLMPIVGVFCGIVRLVWMGLRRAA